jgi:hypothetical protein
MQGQFVFATAHGAGLGVRALLRNTVRGAQVGAGAGVAAMQVGLKVYHDGALVDEQPSFADIAPGGHVELSAASCAVLGDRSRDYLVSAHCRREAGEQYFPQEHQLVYDNGGHTTSILYDQLPIPGGKIRINSILLLAPKVWVGSALATYICIANIGAPGGIELSRWNFEILAQDGKRVHAFTRELPVNGAHVVDVKRELAGHEAVTGPARMFTVVARGETVGAAILTFVRNLETQALALEHSLSPHYYMNGDFARVRREAFMFPAESLHATVPK